MSLDDSVADAIDGFSLAATPGWAGTTTLHHLISHQGGLYDYTPWDDEPTDASLRSRAFEVLAADGWAHSPGGAMWNYSNPNFSLAGLATEEATGRAWADVVEDDLFAPLGLRRTFARESEVEADGNYAIGRGYIQDEPPANPFDAFGDPGKYRVASTDLADVADNGFVRPAGLVWSTAGDMARLGGFLIDGDPTVLDDERLAALHTSHARLYPALAGQGYGYGLFVLDGISLFSGYYNVPVWLHGGNTLSFTSTFYVLPEQRIAISILSNGYGNDFNATIATTIDTVATLPAPVDPPGNPMTATAPEKLVGTYVDPGIGEIIVGEADGKLTLAIPYLEKTLGVSVGDNLTLALTDVYVAKIAGVDYDFTFIADKAGDYRWIRNRLAVGTRVSPAFAPTGTPAQPLDRAGLLVALAEAGQMRAWAAPFQGR